MGVPGRGPFSRFHQGNGLLIRYGLLQDVMRRVPFAILYLTEIPGMALTAGEVASRLVDGEIVFRP
jgi:hypothetical protein